MEPARFAELPIIAGEGRGPAVIGVSFDELVRALGEPDNNRRYEATYYPEWHALGLQVWMRTKDDRASGITLYHGDPSLPFLAELPGRTDRGVGFGSTEAEVIAAYGEPRTVRRKPPSVLVTYDGITFRFADERLVAISVDHKRAPAPSNAVRNAELEAAIIEAPDDDAAYLVYADWLQQHGDSLGEQIVGHHRGGTPYLDEHQAAMLGPLAAYDDMLTERAWRNGLLRAVKVANSFDRSPEHDGEKEAVDVEAVLAMTLDSEIARFLDELTIGIVTYQENDYGDCLATIGVRRLPALRVLFVGDFHSEETELNWSELGDASPLYAGIPNVRTLTLRSGQMQLGAIELPEVRRFCILTGGLRKDGIESIVNAQWPRLERLEIQIGSSRYSSNVGPEDLQPILDGTGLPPTLYHLGLTNYAFTDELVPMLIGSTILPRIRELDLSLGALGPAGARELLDNRAAFAHLARLDLSESWFDPATTAQVRAALPNAILERQRHDPRYPDDRYIAAGE